jgi:hypothetical protein
MALPIAAAVAFLLLGLASAWATRLHGRARLLPPALLAVLLGLVFLELARFDHGQDRLLFAFGFVGAPVAFIFAASLWGTQRFYGWPDLGPLPGQVAVVCLGVLVGVYVGAQVHAGDVAASCRRGDAIAAKLAKWRAAHGAWPDALPEAVPDAPATRMGAACPPPYAYEREDDGARLSFPVGAGRRLVRDLDGTTWRAEP